MTANIILLVQVSFKVIVNPPIDFCSQVSLLESLPLGKMNIP